MSSLHFKESARNLAAALERTGVSLDVYQILNLTDHLITAAVDFTPPAPSPNYATHEGRVQAALNNREVMAFMRNTQKINAIKELRLLTQCGLKEAKEAVEDYRVLGASNYNNQYR